MTITQTITALPAAPSPTDTQSEFDTKSFAHVAAQATLVTQINTWAGQANALAIEVSGYADDAALAASNAGGYASAALGHSNSASSSALLAQDWANKTSGQVSGGEYSAKYYANLAAAVVATIPAGTIDDGTPSTTKVWSSQKVSGELDACAKKGVAQTFTAAQTFGAGVFEKAVAMAAGDIDLALGNFFTKTISGATTLTVSNVPAAGTVGWFILRLTNAGSAAITLPAGSIKPGGTAFSFTASGVDIVGAFTLDGGTTWNWTNPLKDEK